MVDSVEEMRFVKAVVKGLVQFVEGPHLVGGGGEDVGGEEVCEFVEGADFDGSEGGLFIVEA